MTDDKTKNTYPAGFPEALAHAIAADKDTERQLQKYYALIGLRVIKPEEKK